MSEATKPALLEFEDNWSKPAEKKAPEKPVKAPLPSSSFEEEPDEVEPIPEQQPAAAAPGTENQDQPRQKLSASLSAELTSLGIDTIQTVIFSAINNKKIVRRIGRDNIERFGELLQELNESKKKPEDLTEQEKILFWKFRRLKQVQEDIPMNNEEFDKLNEVLEKYYQETGQSLPPWMGLSIALTNILGARLSDAFTE